jgi:hypothetical protein
LAFFVPLYIIEMMRYSFKQVTAKEEERKLIQTTKKKFTFVEMCVCYVYLSVKERLFFLSQGRLDRKRVPSSISMGKNGWEKR